MLGDDREIPDQPQVQIYVLEAAMARPDLLRSWVSDTIGGYEPDFRAARMLSDFWTAKAAHPQATDLAHHATRKTAITS